MVRDILEIAAFACWGLFGYALGIGHNEKRRHR